jgi:uncharacterized protein (DUF362 family)
MQPDRGWDAEEVVFGSEKDVLSSILKQVTAIVNVPFLKTHNIAGLTCCLKNLSHALVKHPARYHRNHCSPYVADIVALPAIRSKLRLHVVNALRTIYEGGPEANEEYTANTGLLLVGKDPVAMDTVALEEINLQRRENGLPSIDHVGGKLGYLAAAAGHNLGCADLHRIHVDKLQL